MQSKKSMETSSLTNANIPDMRRNSPRAKLINSLDTIQSTSTSSSAFSASPVDLSPPLTRERSLINEADCEEGAIYSRPVDSSMFCPSQQLNKHLETESPLSSVQSHHPIDPIGDSPRSASVFHRKIPGVRHHKHRTTEDPSEASHSQACVANGIVDWDSPDNVKNNVAMASMANIVQEPQNPYKDPTREYVSLQDDVYNMFFLSRLGSSAFWYALYVFLLKLALFTFLAIDAFHNINLHAAKPTRVLVSQFLMLPVAVAMQNDLIATFYLVANIKYCKSIQHHNQYAYEWKFHVATFCRALDGAYSLTVNFIILLAAGDVLSLFLNFAALQFLQSIDDIALELAADGYLSDRLEQLALKVQQAELPKRSESNRLRILDSIFFIMTVIILSVVWCLFMVSDQL